MTTTPPEKKSTRKESVTFRPSHAGLDYIEQRREVLGVERTALINAMLTVAARHEAEVTAQIRKTTMLERRQEK
jgi:hypothetical protein